MRPRLHITLELNWSADRQIQQLGRTHRTGQACPPEHVLLVSDVSGEKRFVSTIARRLHSLGALSGEGGGGGSRLAEGKWGDVLESLETPQGSSALQQLYMALGIEVNGADEDDDVDDVVNVVDDVDVDDVDDVFDFDLDFDLELGLGLGFP